MALLLSTNSNESPWLACHAIWQCRIQVPGLSKRNAIARWPNAGRTAVSRRGGLIVLKAPVCPSQGPLSCARTQKSWPCRWIGCAMLRESGAISLYQGNSIGKNLRADETRNFVLNYQDDPFVFGITLFLLLGLVLITLIE